MRVSSNGKEEKGSEPIRELGKLQLPKLAKA